MKLRVILSFRCMDSDRYQKHGLTAKDKTDTAQSLAPVKLPIFFFGRCPELRAGSIAAETRACDWHIRILAEILGSKVGPVKTEIPRDMSP